MEASGANDSSEEASEESGWTTYIDYFLRQERGLKRGGSSQTGDDATVSDAASAAAWAPFNHAEFSTPRACRRLNFKGRKTEVLLDEDPLEDTATSPVSSPKVSGITEAANSCKKEENHVIAEPQGWHGENESAEWKPQARSSASRFAGENKCTELNGRGLCLLPVSMVMDYIT